MIRFVDNQNDLYDVFVFLRVFFKKQGVLITTQENEKKVLQKIGDNEKDIKIVTNQKEIINQIIHVENEPIEFVVFDTQISLDEQNIKQLQNIKKDIYIIKRGDK